MVNIEGNTVITADHALLARGDASIEINKDGKYSTQINGDVVFDYDAETSGTGVNANVDVTLAGANSYWIGNTVVAWAGLPDNVESDKLTVTDMKLTVKNGAQWTPTAIVSTDPTAQNGQRAVALNSLVLDNGVVNITDKSVNATVEKLSGSGTVRLATDLTADEGQQAGTFTVDSADADSSLTVKLANEDLTKDLTSDDVTSDQAKQLLGNVAAEGVETTMKVDEGMYNEGFIIDSEAKVHSTGPNSVMQSTLELATIAPLALNRILTNDVHKRMGDIRSMKQTSGAWARYDGGRLSAESGLENDFHTIQVGVDTVPTAGTPRFGVAFSYTMSDADYRRGKADMDVYSLAAYGLWMGENGQFAAVVRFAYHAVDAAAVAVFLEGERIVDDAVKASGHVEGIDEDDRRLDVAEFLHLRIARHLAEAVREEDARRNLFLEEVAAVRKNRGHARMSALLVVMHVHLADEHAFNVSDGVVLARLQDAELDAVFARTQRVFLGAHRTYHHRTGHGGGHQSLHEIHFFSSFQTGWSCRQK